MPSTRSRVSNFMEMKRYHFYKIILPPNIQQKRIGLPRKFVRKFGKELSEVAELTVPNGTNWNVEMRVTDGNEIWLENGWQEVMDYHSISVGHFLVFGYDGNSRFHVLIFDMSASEIQYPCHNKDIEEYNQEKNCQPSSKESDSVEILDVSPQCPIQGDGSKDLQQIPKRRHLVTPLSRFRYSLRSVNAGKITTPTVDFDLEATTTATTPVKSSSKRAWYSTKKSNEPFSTCRVTQRTGSDECHSSQQEESKADVPIIRSSNSTGSVRIRPMTTLLKERAIEAARAFKSDNPFFKIIMCPSYLDKYKLCVPMDFARKYLKQKPPRFTLCASNGRKWQVGCFYRKSYTILCGGWKKFSSENCLEKGDVCIFELVGRYHPEMKVFIYRARANASITKSSYSINADKHDSPLKEESSAGVSITRRRPIAALLKKSAVEAARAFKSNKPFCMVVMRPSYVHRPFILNMPINFFKKYLGAKSSHFTLRVSDRAWHVHCSYRKPHFKLIRGWKEFATENHLKEGDVCVFELHKRYHIEMEVVIYRAKGNMHSSKKNREVFSACRVTQRTESDEYDSPLREESSPDLSISRRPYSTVSLRRPTTTLLKGSAIEAAKAFKSSKPFCMIMMQPSYVDRLFVLNVPRKFARKYLKLKPRIVTLQVAERKWLVKFSAGESYAKLKRGWKKFARENHLHVGDVCVFERIKRNPFEMKVIIYRASTHR